MVTVLPRTVMSNRNIQCLIAVLLFTEQRNKVHPLAEDEWVDAVIETPACGKSKFKFQDAEIASAKVEGKLLLCRSETFSESRWVPMTWLPTRVEGLRRETQTVEAFLVSKHHVLGLPVQAKPVWDAISQRRANVPQQESDWQTGRRMKKLLAVLSVCNPW